MGIRQSATKRTRRTMEKYWTVLPSNYGESLTMASCHVKHINHTNVKIRATLYNW